MVFTPAAENPTTGDLEGGVAAPATQKHCMVVCLKNCLGCLCGAVAGASVMAIRLSSLCLFVSGLIFTIQEFNDIPECAKPYEAWSITMVVVSFMGMTRSEKEEKTQDPTTLGLAFLILSIFPGLIAGLGTRDVLDYPAESCDVSGIADLVTWTEVIIYFNWALMGLLQLAGLACFIM